MLVLGAHVEDHDVFLVLQLFKFLWLQVLPCFHIGVEVAERGMDNFGFVAHMNLGKGVALVGIDFEFSLGKAGVCLDVGHVGIAICC